MKRTRWIVVAVLAISGAACGGGASLGSPTGGTGGAGAAGTGGTATGGTPATGGTGASGPPGAFALLGPVQGSSSQPLTPQLSWESAAGATSYAVEIATDATFGNSDVYQQTVGAPTTTLAVPTATLFPGVVYYWRVSAVNGADYTMATGAPQWFSSPYKVAGARGLAATPDGTMLVVASGINQGPVDLIDLANSTVTSIATGVASQPVGVAVSPDGKQALVTVNTSGASGVNGVAVIDLVHGVMDGGIDDPCVGTTLTDVAYFPNGAAAMPDLSSDCIAMGLTAFTPDVNNPQFTFTNLHDTNDPYGVAIDPSGTYAVVTMELDRKLYRVNFGVSVDTLDLSAPSAGVAIAPDGKTIVVAEATLDFIDVATGTVTPVSLWQDVPGGDFHNVAVTADSEVAAVVGENSIQFLSLTDHTVLAAYPADGANDVAISPDGSWAYVSDRANGLVRVVPIP